MPITCTVSNHFKYKLLTSGIDFDNDTFKVLLMKDGFIFDPDSHAKLANIKPDTTAITMNAIAGLNKFTRASGSFLTDGFLPNGYFTASGFGGTTDGDYRVATVSALTLTVTEIAGGGVVEDITGGGNERFIGDDEIETGYGYTQGAEILTVAAVTEDDAVNDSCLVAFNDVQWTVTSEPGDQIGPTPGAIIYDDTSSDDTIVCYVDFQTAQTKLEDQNFDIADIEIELS